MTYDPKNIDPGNLALLKGWEAADQARMNLPPKPGEGSIYTSAYYQERGRIDADEQARRYEQQRRDSERATERRASGGSHAARPVVMPHYDDSSGVSYRPGFSARVWSVLTAPFRLAWALLKVLFKLALVVTVATVAYLVFKDGERTTTSPAAVTQATGNGFPPAAPDAPPANAAEIPRGPAPAMGEPPRATQDHRFDPPVVESPEVNAAPSPAEVETDTSERALRPRLGARVVDVPAERSTALRLADGEGALVQGVVPGGPAARSEMLAEDIVLSINGKSVHGADDLIRLVRAQELGVLMRVVVLREGERLSANIMPDGVR